MNKTTDKNKLFRDCLIFLFLGITLWRLVILFIYPSLGGDAWISSWYSFWWGGVYQILALFGAIYGFSLMKSWGGIKSIMGRTVLMFSLGLLAQVFGQTVSTYYVFKGLGVPYPSIGDIGFFSSVLFYIYGAILLTKLSGFKSSIKNVKNKIFAVIIPTILLLSTYYFFFQGYQFDFTQPLKILLDFGYPFGQAIYVSFAIFAFIIARKELGGILRKPIIFFIISLVAQYIADYIFLFQSNNGTYIAGGLDDYLYVVAYFLMSLSLIQLGTAFYKIRNS